MSWLEDLIQSFEQAAQDEGVPEPGENDIAEGPSDGLYAGYNFDADRTPLSPSEDSPEVGTMPSQVWPGDDYGGRGEEPGAGWNALRQQYQVAGLGAGGTAASEPRHAWLDDVNWEDLPILRQLAQAHGEPRGSRGFDGEPNALPEAWLDKVTPTDLLFIRVLASARRLAALNERRDDEVPSPLFAPPPASIGPAEMTPSLDLRRELKAFRALHPNEFAERGESGGGGAGSGRGMSLGGGPGVTPSDRWPLTPGWQQPSQPDLSENPELAALRRWRQVPLSPSPNDWRQELWNNWDAFIGWLTGNPTPAAPTPGPTPTWTPTPTTTGTPTLTATRVPTAKPTRTLAPRQTKAPEHDDDADVKMVARALVGEAGVFPEEQREDNYAAIAWVWRNNVARNGGHYKDYLGMFHGYDENIVPTKEAMDAAQKVLDAQTNQDDPTNGALHFLSYHDLLNFGYTPEEIRTAVNNGLFNYQVEWWNTKGQETPQPAVPPAYGHYFSSQWPAPMPTHTPTLTPTAKPTRTPTPSRTRRPTSTPTPKRR